MKIAFTCDLHHHPQMTTSDDIFGLAEKMVSAEPDLVIIGGDIAECRTSILLFNQVLDILDVVGSGALVLGNHDLWTSQGKRTSLDLWQDTLPTITREMGWHYLEQENWTKDGVAVVGSYLHYDYSAADPEGAVAEYIKTQFPDWTTDEYYERMKKRVVNDAKFFRGLPNDKKFAKQIGDDFRKRLLEAENDPAIHSIVIATHIPCMPSQITRKPNEWHWSCATAYFGNLSHVPIIRSCSKVKYVLSGHSHQGNNNQVLFDDGHMVEVINSDSDYGKPTFCLLTI